MKRGIRLRPEASSDLIAIWHYSAREWGEDRADRYVRDLHDAMQRIAVDPMLGTNCEGIAKGYRRIATGSHLIFYRHDAETVDVVRILHQRMDVIGRLR